MSNKYNLICNNIIKMFYKFLVHPIKSTLKFVSQKMAFFQIIFKNETIISLFKFGDRKGFNIYKPIELTNGISENFKKCQTY